MFQRLATRLTLACYGVIALSGQGLPLFLHECGHEIADHYRPALVSPLNVAGVSSGADWEGDNDSLTDRSEHDCDHCAICQHQSLGQIFVALPPVEIVLAACEVLSPLAPELVVCPAHFSVAQPRAPPVVI